MNRHERIIRKNRAYVARMNLELRAQRFRNLGQPIPADLLAQIARAQAAYEQAIRDCETFQPDYRQGMLSELDTPKR
jgi:hypothetical protein